MKRIVLPMAMLVVMAFAVPAMASPHSYHGRGGHYGRSQVGHYRHSPQYGYHHRPYRHYGPQYRYWRNVHRPYYYHDYYRQGGGIRFHGRNFSIGIGF